uniref:Spexin n=1 Tax=Nothobranchius furzeri TaxID=105023 RepID=A0A8C6LLL1_NOTFU
MFMLLLGFLFAGFLIQGLRSVPLIRLLTLLLLAALISQSWSTPKGSFQRRNWTPQAMLYLKGTQGRRFISEDRKEGNVYDTLHLETRSQNTEKLSVDQAAAVLLNFLQQAREGGEVLCGSEHDPEPGSGSCKGTLKGVL